MFWNPDQPIIIQQFKIFHDLILTIGLISIGDPTLEIPLLKVIVGNPTLLEVKAEGFFDYTDSYLMEISATSKALRQVRL